MSHDYTLGCQNERGVFDVFANVRDEQATDATNIILLSTTQKVAQRIIDIMVERGLLVECEGGQEQQMYELTEKGRQLGQDAKQRMLEDQAHG